MNSPRHHSPRHHSPRRHSLICRWVSVAIALTTTIAAPLVGAQEADAKTARFTASPATGRAPLTVTFCSAAGISLNFGDGATSGFGLAKRGDCRLLGATAVMVRHTYAKPGTYQLRGMPCPGSSGADVCAAVAQQANGMKIIVRPQR